MRGGGGPSRGRGRGGGKLWHQQVISRPGWRGWAGCEKPRSLIEGDRWDSSDSDRYDIIPAQTWTVDSGHCPVQCVGRQARLWIILDWRQERKLDCLRALTVPARKETGGVWEDHGDAWGNRFMVKWYNSAQASPGQAHQKNRKQSPTRQTQTIGPTPPVSRTVCRATDYKICK